MFTITIFLLVVSWPNLWHIRPVFYVLLLHSYPFYGTGIIILAFQIILEVRGGGILFIWHIVGYINDLFAAQPLVRIITPNYPTNYNIVLWENFSSWNCWLIIIKKEQLNIRWTKTKILFWSTITSVHKASTKSLHLSRIYIILFPMMDWTMLIAFTVKMSHW